MLIETAPMAAYTSVEFRRVLVALGARVVWTEMASVAALFFGNEKSVAKTKKILEFDKVKGVKNVAQIFGHVPEHFAFAIEKGYLDGFDEININMGCPAQKVVKNGEGVGLMTKPDLAREIIETCVRASNARHKIPVSAKIRLGKNFGFDYVSYAKMCESAGVSRLIVHGRYGEQFYTGKANWNAIAEIVKAVKIPVIANGDVKNYDDAKRCLEITGAAGVMVGRALLPIYRKYFSQNLQMLRGEKICLDGGIDPNNSIIDLFSRANQPG